MATNTQKLAGSWNEIKGQVKEKWGQLTDDDLKIGNGNIDQLIGRIQHKTGEARESIEKFLDGLSDKGSSMASNAAESVSRFAQGAGEHLRENADQVGDTLHQGYEQAYRMVRNNPTQSVAAVFGIGIGLGLLVGLSLRSR
jgi:uncharacterized protein YjbJ (UPF0337 family)